MLGSGNGMSRRALMLACCLAALAAATPALADRIAHPTAVFAGLDKITGRIISFEAAIDETVQFGSLQITPRVCFTRPATEAPLTTGFVEVEEVSTGNEFKRIFGGWMFAASPGLHGIEHPVYDAWLTDCKGGKDIIPDAVARAPEVVEPSPAAPPPANANRPRRQQQPAQPGQAAQPGAAAAQQQRPPQPAGRPQDTGRPVEVGAAPGAPRPPGNIPRQGPAGRRSSAARPRSNSIPRTSRRLRRRRDAVRSGSSRNGSGRGRVSGAHPRRARSRARARRSAARPSTRRRSSPASRSPCRACGDTCAG